MDILTGENLTSIKVSNVDLIYWPIRLSSRKGEDRLKEVVEGIAVFYSYEYHFIRVNENLVQHPIYNNRFMQSTLKNLKNLCNNNIGCF